METPFELYNRTLHALTVDEVVSALAALGFDGPLKSRERTYDLVSFFDRCRVLGSLHDMAYVIPIGFYGGPFLRYYKFSLEELLIDYATHCHLSYGGQYVRGALESLPFFSELAF